MQVTAGEDDANAPIKNQITLRDAIKTGNNGPLAPAVTFLPAVGGTIPLQAALPSIQKNYDILGPGYNNLAVDGSVSYRVFAVDSGVTSTISGLTIQNGFIQNGNGAGIFNQGNLTLNNDNFYGNQAEGDGGGIANDQSAELSLQQVLIQNNTAGLDGGGLDNVGTVKIYNGVELYNNKSDGSAGGIANRGAGTISAYSNVLITGNKALGGRGGGVWNLGSGKFQIFDGGTITGNTSAGDGGGVFNSIGTMTLQGVSLETNGASGRGGGIFVQSGNLTLTDVDFYSKNSANLGGGMYVRGGTVKMSGGSFSNNLATFTGKSVRGGLINGGGGGLFVGGGTVTLTGVSIQNNWANFDGGGVFNDAGGTLTLNGNIENAM